MRRSTETLAVVVAVGALGVGSTARAQMDLAGMWGQRFHEELPERGAGPEIGHRAHREDQLAVLGLPVLVGRRDRAREVSTSLLVGAQLDPGLDEGRAEPVEIDRQAAQPRRRRREVEAGQGGKAEGGEIRHRVVVHVDQIGKVGERVCRGRARHGPPGRARRGSLPPEVSVDHGAGRSIEQDETGPDGQGTRADAPPREADTGERTRNGLSMPDEEKPSQSPDDAVRHRQRNDVAVAVLVLEPFAGERGTAGGRAEQEAARA